MMNKIDLTEDQKSAMDEFKKRRKWLNAITSSSKYERSWRDKCETILKKYRGDDEKKNSFNILYSNTDTLSPAVYNSQPKPDVRRRWSDEDKVGKAVSEVLNRALSFCIDNDEFEASIESVLYDYLLLGRGVSRIRYVPSISTYNMDEESMEEKEEDEVNESESFEEIAWEQVVLEHVQYTDFRRGPGRTWNEVQWVAFKHNLDKEEIAERFGEDKVSTISFGEVDDGSSKKENEGKIQNGTAEVWEIWDKDEKEVIFVTESYSVGLLNLTSDPLELKGFYPVPKPVYAFTDSTNLIPVPLYALYEQQALELDRVSSRINRIISALKVRGIYDATISELDNLMQGEETKLIPAQNISMIIDRGGLDKAIWFMDIAPLAVVLQQLYEQREQTKQVIYEIMGLSDILRGSSNANETATAQGIKAQWGGMRVSRMQKAIQLYIRDVIRLMAEVIGQKFQIETLQGMTGLNYPTQQEQQQQLIAWQVEQSRSQEPIPQPEKQVTWEEIKSVLADDLSRNYKIDVETDSTIAASQQTDMMALKDLIASVSQVYSELAPYAQAGVMPIEAIKELSMAVIRRGKLGNAVEDAFDKVHEPEQKEPQPDPKVLLDVEKAKMEKEKQQNDVYLKQAELQQARQESQQDAQLQIQLEQMRIDAQLQLKQMEIKAQLEMKQMELINNNQNMVYNNETVLPL